MKIKVLAMSETLNACQRKLQVPNGASPTEATIAAVNRSEQVRLCKTQGVKKIQPCTSNCAWDFPREERHRRVRTEQWHPPLPDMTQCPHWGRGLLEPVLKTRLFTIQHHLLANSEKLYNSNFPRFKKWEKLSFKMSLYHQDMVKRHTGSTFQSMM